MSAHEAATTFYCQFPNCTNEAPSRYGRYAYCEEHRTREQRGQATNGKPSKGLKTGLAATIAGLAKDAKAVDAARAKATKLTEKALAAKRHADDLEADFQRKLAAATGAANSHPRADDAA